MSEILFEIVNGIHLFINEDVCFCSFCSSCACVLLLVVGNYFFNTFFLLLHPYLPPVVR